MNEGQGEKNVLEDNNNLLINHQELENDLDLEEIIYDEEFNEPNQEEDDDYDDINELADIIEKSRNNQSMNHELNPHNNNNNNQRKRDKSALDNQRISNDNANPRIRDKSAPKMLNKGMSEEYNNNCSIDIKVDEKEEAAAAEERKNNEKKKKVLLFLFLF
jgi:hypothetical protein